MFVTSELDPNAENASSDGLSGTEKALIAVCVVLGAFLVAITVSPRDIGSMISTFFSPTSSPRRVDAFGSHFEKEEGT